MTHIKVMDGVTASMYTNYNKNTTDHKHVGLSMLVHATSRSGRQRRNSEMFQPASPSIYSITLRPLKCLMYLLGIIPYNWVRPTGADKHLQCAHTCAILTLIALISYYWFQYLDRLIYHADDIFSSSIDVLGFAPLVTLHLTIQVESTWKLHYYQRIFRKFEQLRALLLSKFAVRFNCALLQFYVRLLHAQLALYCAVMAVYLVLLHLSPLPTARLLLIVFSELVLKLKMFEFTAFAIVVMVMHSELCVAAQRFLQQLDASRYDPWPLRRRCLTRFFDLQELHSLLWEIVRDIAAYFEWSLPGMLLKQFLDLTLMAYWTYLAFENNARLLTKQYIVVMWTLQGLVLSVSCIICTICEKSDKKFRSTFHGIIADRRNLYLGACLRRISLQLKHERIYFTGGDFIVVNTKTLGMFYFGAIMYIVILIQFRMSV